METQYQVNLCDICGDVGYGELLATCKKCGIFRHIYCMTPADVDVLEMWICEDCIPKEDRFGGKENFQNSSNDAVMEGDTTKNDESERYIHCKSRKAMQSGKVKFLPTEEAIKLVSGAAKFELPSKSNLGYRSGTSSVPKFSTLRVNPNPKGKSFMKPPGHGRIQVSSMISQQAHRTSNEQKATIQSVKGSSCIEQKNASFKSANEVKTCNSNVLAKGVKTCDANLIGQKERSCNMKAEEAVNKSLCTSSTSVHHPPIIEERALVAKMNGHFCKKVNARVPAKDVETVNMDKKNVRSKASCALPSRLYSLAHSSGSGSCPVELEERHVVSILPRHGTYHPHFPIEDAIWKGGFMFPDTVMPGEFYRGFQAQPPSIVSRKAYKFSRTMPIVLQVVLLPQNHVWDNLFQNDYPDFRDIALYFFPSANVERSNENHTNLYRLLETQNSIMRSCIDDVELLIFTSKQLHVDSLDVIEKSSTKHLLCGIFRHSKREKIQRNCTSMECSDPIDMEIDMKGGQPVGRVDTIVTKESSKMARGESIKEAVHEDDMKLSNDDILYANMQSIIQAQCNLVSLFSEGTQKINSDSPSVHSSQNLVKLADATHEVDIPPGFEELSGKKPRNMSCIESTIQQLHLKYEEALRNCLSLFSEITQKINSDSPLADATHGVDTPPVFEELSGQKPRNISWIARVTEEEPPLNEERVVSPAKEGNIGLQGVAGDGYPPSCSMVVKIEEHNLDQMDFRHESSTRPPVETCRPACWSPPATGWIKLNVAGSLKGGNPGEAGASGIIRDESGKWVLGYSLNLGTQTVLGAELWAIFQGLKLSWKNGFRKVLVESESLLAVEYLKKTPNLLDTNRALVDCCTKLIKLNWDCKVVHIDRSANLSATWLASRFHEHPPGMTVFNSPPYNLVPALRNDSMKVECPPCPQMINT